MDYIQQDTLLKVTGAALAYGDKLIVDAVSFSIRDTKRPDQKSGQSVAIVGRSGRGKSTIFKLLTGLVTPTKGTIEIFNGKGGLRPIREGEVGFVQQKYPLSRNQTVNEMLLQAARLGGIPANDRQRMIDQKLSEWNLEKQKFHAANQLSGGQCQRVAILEQILCSKNFIILDEPFSGLDVKNKIDVRESFNRIVAADDFNTVIFSTHEIELAVELADQIIVIGYPTNEKGELVQVGTVIESFDLKALGLAWKPFSPAHVELQHVVESVITRS